MQLVGNMWNLNRRMWNSYMQRMNELHPHSVSTKMNSLAYTDKMHKKRTSTNQYNEIPNMRTALGEVRNSKRTLNLKMVNATTSKTRT